MIAFDMGDRYFQYRTAGIIIHDGFVLLQEFPKYGHWALPGGRVDPLELSHISITRELHEELGVESKVLRQVYFAEVLFNHKGKKYHEIGSYYLVEIEDEKLLYKNEDHYGVEGNQKIRFRWFNLKELEKVELLPKFLKKGLLNIPENLTKITEVNL